MHVIQSRSFEDWRARSRELLSLGIPPMEVDFVVEIRQKNLFGSVGEQFGVDRSQRPVVPAFRVTPRLLTLAELVSCHNFEGRFNLLYRVLWRITHGEPDLLQLATDVDVHALLMMEKAVRRDSHKAKAFVRFRRVESPDGTEQFIAWHQPDHRILKLVAPFFSRRFPKMNWTILTPHESVNWDGQNLAYGSGVPASAAPQGDQLEHLWKTYYANIFNPARVNLKMMTQEMPRRYWDTLPEAEIIQDLLSRAPQRVVQMISHQEGLKRSAADFQPELKTLPELRDAASRCQGCDLCFNATQTVFGEGRSDARLMIVGEQPGDQEDLLGQVFVGPAGQVLNEAFEKSGIDRSQIYLTNAVKHFKFTQHGKLRLHGKPTYLEILACQPWLHAEIEAIQPTVLMCLGVSAAQTVIGRHFKLTQERGHFVETSLCLKTIASFHPSAILRAKDEATRTRMLTALISDLIVAAQSVAASET